MEITLEQFCQALRDMSDWHCINDSHDVRVSEIALKIGERLNLTEEQLHHLKYGALLHDIGRVGIEDNVLSKKSKLTESQYGAVKSHPEIGYKIIKNVLPKEICEIVLYHHECFDGTGYPKGIRGNDIPYLARIVKIADVWDALTSNRPYRKSLSAENALHIMNLEQSYFDPKIYIVFLEMIREEK